MKREILARCASAATSVISKADNFWENPNVASTPHEMLRYSAIMGILPFSGFLIYYALIGQIWNWYPFVRTSLPVSRAIMCAGLQWVFFLTFPLLSSLVLDFFSSTHHTGPEFNSRVLITTYSMTPLFLAAFFVGVPFVNRVVVVLSLSTFIYLLYYGYRFYAHKSVVRSALMTLLVTFLFALIRQMFVFVIGF
jgi:hypothetical protein